MTTLQIIKKELEGKMARALADAIKAGAKVEKSGAGGAHVDGIYITSLSAYTPRGLVLDIECPELEEALAPTKPDLENRAGILRAELKEIEEQLKEIKQ